MTFLTKVCSRLKELKIPYAVVGGYAVSLHQCVRGTIDIDLITKTDLNTYKNIEIAMSSLNLESRLPLRASDVYNFREEYINNRNLVAWNFFNPQNPLESVDIIITKDIDGVNVVEKKIGHLKVKVLALKDLIDMKTESGRPQDLEDVKALKSKL